MKARVQVTIPDNKYIPTIGKGPINRPISIFKDQYDMLVRFGFNIKLHEQPKLDKIEKVEEKPVKAVKEAEVTEPVVEEEVAEVIEEPVQEEETTEEIVEETPVEEEVPADETYTMEDLAEATKDELKEILEKRNKKFPYNANLGKLKELVVESNPK